MEATSGIEETKTILLWLTLHEDLQLWKNYTEQVSANLLLQPNDLQSD